MTVGLRGSTVDPAVTGRSAMSVRAYRAAMIAGAASALLLFFGSSTMYGSTPDTNNKTADVVAQKWVDFINDSGKRHAVLIGGFLIVLRAPGPLLFAPAPPPRPPPAPAA